MDRRCVRLSRKLAAMCFPVALKNSTSHMTPAISINTAYSETSYEDSSAFTTAYSFYSNIDYVFAAHETMQPVPGLVGS